MHQEAFYAPVYLVWWTTASTRALLREYVFRRTTVDIWGCASRILSEVRLRGDLEGVDTPHSPLLCTPCPADVPIHDPSDSDPESEEDEVRAVAAAVTPRTKKMKL